MGFGEEAAQAYQEVQRQGSSVPKWTEEYRGIEAPQPPGCKIYPVAFMGNPQSSEIQHLLAVYEQELQVV